MGPVDITGPRVVDAGSDSIAFTTARGAIAEATRAALNDARWDGERRVFWTLQLVWWSTFMLTQGPISALAGSLRFGFLPFIVQFLSLLAATFVMRAIYQRNRPRGLVFCAVVFAAVALAWTIFGSSLNYYLRETFSSETMTQLNIVRFADFTLKFFWFIMCWVALYVAFVERAFALNQQTRLARAEALASRAQLSMLRFQINPHFIFNSLNAISALVLDRRLETAEAMIVRLSRFIRHTLESEPNREISLTDEITTQELYLFIEKARFDDRLKVNMDIAADASECLVPSLVLQPVIENAIKFAIAPNPDGGVVSVRARRLGAHLELTVSDTGPGKGVRDVGGGPSTGLGLRVTAERLTALYGDAARLEAGPASGGGYDVRILIPYHRKDDDDARPAG